jgi:hypothetical protein
VQLGAPLTAQSIEILVRKTIVPKASSAFNAIHVKRTIQALDQKLNHGPARFVAPLELTLTLLSKPGVILQ